MTVRVNLVYLFFLTILCSELQYQNGGLNASTLNYKLNYKQLVAWEVASSTLEEGPLDAVRHETARLLEALVESSSGLTSLSPVTLPRGVLD